VASTGYLETLLNTLPSQVKSPLVQFVREAFKTLRFGAPDADDAVAAENFGGHLVPFVTADVANNEVAVAHGLGRTPRLLIPCMPLNVVNATLPDLTITQAADATYFYISSPTVGASCWCYLE
jgi:hypothetical protein